MPVATHNQRGLGTLHIGATEGVPLAIDARTLLAIVEDSMSSEIYELMKRVDEAAVVEKAHRRPRFVEDCVREMISGVVARCPSCPTTRSSRRARRTSRRSTSTTSRPSATARSASCARSCASGEPSPRHTTLREWLDFWTPAQARDCERCAAASRRRSPKK